ncbi:mediator of RNA polymerase II transcription subunit 25-like [Cajanus cajan]|uniref:mediator of RNA polymerase II transcription subunit 25-like n=1 Tax=Cajanus cajan TaxID=3821 RepID=UPI0010FAD447|nr:mediator of RNA polymerase II transcription subunit 25-like [Cajanus cajan]
MYNASPNLGNDVQYINWTKDLDYFIRVLSGLSFNGPNLYQHKIAEGLAEALVMFPRPPDKLATIQEYFMGERHCILLATGNPVPQKMNVSVPLIKDAKFVPSQLKPLYGNFLEVAPIFGELAISLSIITPMHHPMYREIFNSANNVSPMVNNPIEYRMDELTFLLSRNFKEAHNVLYRKGKTVSTSKESAVPMKTKSCVTPPIISSTYPQENLLSANSMIPMEQTIEGVQNVMHALESAVTSLHPVIPQVTAAQTCDPSPISSQLPKQNVFENLMANLCNDDGGDIIPWKKPKFIPTFNEEEEENSFRDLFKLDKPLIPFVDTLGQEKTLSSNQSISLEALKEGEPTQVLMDIATQSVSKEIAGEGSSRVQALELGGNVSLMNPIPASENFSSFSFSQPLVASTYTAGEGSSRGLAQEQGSNMGVVNNIPTSKTFSNSNFSFPQPVVASNCTVGEGSSRGQVQELGGNLGITNPIPTLENGSNYSFSLPRLINPDLWPMWVKELQQPSGGNNTTVGLGTPNPLPHDPPRVGASLGNSLFPNSTENLLNQCQSTSSPSFNPVLSYGGGGGSSGNGSSSHQQLQRQIPYKYTELSHLGTPAMREWAQQYNPRNILLPPLLMDIKDYVVAWEGCLVGRVHAYRACLSQARVMIKPTSPSSLTSTWSSRLEILIFIPITAVKHTLKIIGRPIDYVFFHIIQFNNLDVYEHLMSKNLCAKIELPLHTIILSTTESKHHFLGIIFPRDTVFVEPA